MYIYGDVWPSHALFRSSDSRPLYTTLYTHPTSIYTHPYSGWPECNQSVTLPLHPTPPTTHSLTGLFKTPMHYFPMY